MLLLIIFLSIASISPSKVLFTEEESKDETIIEDLDEANQEKIDLIQEIIQKQQKMIEIFEEKIQRQKTQNVFFFLKFLEI